MFTKIIIGGLYYLNDDINNKGKHPHIVVADMLSQSTGFKKIQTLGMTSSINSDGNYVGDGLLNLPVLTGKRELGIVVTNIIRSWQPQDFIGDRFGGIWNDDKNFTREQFVKFLLSLYTASLTMKISSTTDWIESNKELILQYDKYCRDIEKIVQTNQITLPHSKVIWRYEPNDYIKEALGLVDGKKQIKLSGIDNPFVFATDSGDKPIDSENVVGDIIFDIEDVISENVDVKTDDTYIINENENSGEKTASDIITKYKLRKEGNKIITTPKLPKGRISITRGERYMLIPSKANLIYKSTDNYNTLCEVVDPYCLLSQRDTANVINLFKDDKYPSLKVDWVSNDMKTLVNIIGNKDIDDIINNVNSDSLLKVYTILSLYQPSYINQVVDTYLYPALTNIYTTRDAIGSKLEMDANDVYNMSAFDFQTTFSQFGVNWLSVLIAYCKINIMSGKDNRSWLKRFYDITGIYDNTTDKLKISDIVLNAIITACNVVTVKRYCELSDTELLNIPYIKS